MMQWDSPCVDGGDPSTVDACLPPGLGGAGADMGAFGGDQNCLWNDWSCESEVVIDALPSSVEAGSDLSVTVQARSRCFETGAFDRIEVEVSGPAARHGRLHDGPAILLAPFETLDFPRTLHLPAATPLGRYTVRVRMLREGEPIDADVGFIDVV